MKAVFLDRDGVINEYPGHFKYVACREEFRFLPGAKAALEKLSAQGLAIFVVSNQAGVTKGIYDLDELNAITRKMLDGLGPHVKVSGVRYCIHREEDNCSCRKPKPGMIEEIAAEARKGGREIEMAASFFVGDSVRDVEAGRNAGLKTILVFSGRERPENRASWKAAPDFTARDLSEAAEIILRGVR